MANIIKPKRSSVASKVPTTTDIGSGEIAVNSTDQKIYTNNGTSVVQIGAGKLSGLSDVSISGITSGQSISWNGTAFVPSSAGSGSVTGVTGTAPIISSGGTAPVISISAATTSAAGSMSATDKTKLDGIAAGATNVTNTNQLTNGAGFITSSGNAATASSTPKLSIQDLRSTALTPSYFGQGLNAAFMANSTDGLSDGGTYHGIAHFQQWSDASGGGAHQLGFTDGGNIWRRSSGAALTSWSSWYKLVDSGNYNSYSPTLTGGGASGTWGISVTGNAATAGGFTPSQTNGTANRIVVADSNGYINNNYFNSTDNSIASGVTGVMVKQGDNYLRTGTAAAIATFISGQSMNISGNATNLSTGRTNWSTNGTITAVVGQLSWKNYGNNHTIFDASASTSPDGTAINNTNAAVAWTGTYPTLMGWNGSSTYGVRVDSARVADNGGVTSIVAGSGISISGGTGAVTISASAGTSPIPAGSTMLFISTAAPTGWTKVTTHDNKALRIVSGTAGSGGSVAFTTAFAASLSVGATTISTAQMPSHTHSEATYGSAFYGGVFADNNYGGAGSVAATTGATGGGGSHTHTLPSFAVSYVDAIIATKN